MAAPPYSFGDRSSAALDTVDPRLRAVLEEAIQRVDFTVLEGRRSKAEQDAAVHRGASKVYWPDSAHNVECPACEGAGCDACPLARAVDVAPYPIDWSDAARFAYLAGVVVGIADQMGVALRWGGDWDRDGDLRDQTFDDLPHIEMV